MAAIGLLVVAIGAAALPAAPWNSRDPRRNLRRTPRARLLLPAAPRRLLSWPPPLAAKPLSTELFFAGYQHTAGVYMGRVPMYRLARNESQPVNSKGWDAGSIISLFLYAYAFSLPHRLVIFHFLLVFICLVCSSIISGYFLFLFYFFHFLLINL